MYREYRPTCLENVYRRTRAKRFSGRCFIQPPCSCCCYGQLPNQQDVNLDLTLVSPDECEQFQCGKRKYRDCCCPQPIGRCCCPSSVQYEKPCHPCCCREKVQPKKECYDERKSRTCCRIDQPTGETTCCQCSKKKEASYCEPKVTCCNCCIDESEVDAGRTCVSIPPQNKLCCDCGSPAEEGFQVSIQRDNECCNLGCRCPCLEPTQPKCCCQQKSTKKMIRDKKPCCNCPGNLEPVTNSTKRKCDCCKCEASSNHQLPISCCPVLPCCGCGPFAMMQMMSWMSNHPTDVCLPSCLYMMGARKNARTGDRKRETNGNENDEPKRYKFDRNNGPKDDDPEGKNNTDNSFSSGKMEDKQTTTETKRVTFKGASFLRRPKSRIDKTTERASFVSYQERNWTNGNAESSDHFQSNSSANIIISSHANSISLAEKPIASSTVTPEGGDPLSVEPKTIFKFRAPLIPDSQSSGDTANEKEKQINKNTFDEENVSTLTSLEFLTFRKDCTQYK